MIMFFQN